MQTSAGAHIATECARAIQLAIQKNCLVKFKFNDVMVEAAPVDTVDYLVRRWDDDREAAHRALVESPEYKAREAAREAEEKRKDEAHMVESATTEQELREAKAPWPRNQRQLTEYIDSLVNRNHDYGTCVYAMSLAATAAFYFVSHQLGVTGFQASAADLDFISRTRNMKGPFILIKAEDALYPQYDLRETPDNALAGWRPWLKEQAQKNLAENRQAHPNVLAHWKKLAQ